MKKKEISNFQAAKARRDQKIKQDFINLRQAYAALHLLYAEIARRNHCSSMTVQRALHACGLDGVQGLRKRVKTANKVL